MNVYVHISITVNLSFEAYKIIWEVSHKYEEGDNETE